MLRLALCITGCVGILTTAMEAQAANRRIAVIRGDTELLRAISLALAPWGVDTIPSDLATPESAQPQAVLHAAKLSQKLGVDAIVWVSGSSQGSLLWIYDARRREVTTRVLGESPPFESAAAAAVALSVKTVLRASIVPPVAERFEAPSSQPKADRLALEAGADLHLVAQGKMEPRLTLGGALWLTQRRWFGVGLALAAGPGVSVNTTTFVGRYRELALGSSARLRFLNRKTLAASFFVGATSHSVILDGALVEDSSKSTVRRFNLSVDAGAKVDVKLGGGTYLGLCPQASYLPAYQRYLVEGAPVLALWPVAASMGAHFGIELL